MEWKPTHDDQVYMAFIRQHLLQGLQNLHDQMRAWPEAAELPDRWLQPQRFTTHEEGVLMCGILHAAIEGAAGTEGSDPRLPYMVVNGETDYVRALVGLTQAGARPIFETPRRGAGGRASGVSEVTEVAQTAAPARRQKHATTMRQQMDQYNELVDYARSIGMTDEKYLGGPNRTNTFASWVQGDKSTQRLKQRIKEHEEKGEEGGGNGAG